MYQPLEKIKAEFDRVGLRCVSDAKDGLEALTAGFELEGRGMVPVRFLCEGEDDPVGVHILGLLSGGRRHRKSLLRAVNRCNEQFRFCKLSVDEEGDVNLQYDLPVSADPGPMAVELFLRWTRLCERVYPALLEAL